MSTTSLASGVYEGTAKSDLKNRYKEEWKCEIWLQLTALREGKKRFNNISQPVSSQSVVVRVEAASTDPDHAGVLTILNFFVSSEWVGCRKGIPKYYFGLYFRSIQLPMTCYENEIASGIIQQNGIKRMSRVSRLLKMDGTEVSRAGHIQTINMWSIIQKPKSV